MEPKLGGLTGIRNLHKAVSHLGKASHWAYIQLTKKKKKKKEKKVCFWHIDGRNVTGILEEYRDGFHNVFAFDV